MKKVVTHFRKYHTYVFYSAKSELKNEIVNSYLNWLWWVLDPLFFMLIYTFIVKIVFNASEPNFPIFVLLGLTVWNFFSKIVSTSVKIVSGNKGLISKVYIPKYMLILQKIWVNLFKLGVSIILIFIMMAIFQVMPTILILYALPLTILLIILTFGIAIFLAHFGVLLKI